MKRIYIYSIILFFITASSCGQKQSKETASNSLSAQEAGEYKTKNVIILVIDGPRYTETWGDSTHQYTPQLANKLAKSAVIYSNFYNDGPTYTNAGHTAITTGIYQEINNNGKELPQNSSIFQHWMKKNNKQRTTAWVIASKDKLEVLADTQDSVWNGQYMPSTNCGIDGNGSGYRQDSVTFNKTIEVLSNQHPQLVLINFREPDSSGHGGNWENYLNGIRDTDEYLYQLWQFIESDPYYKGTTTLFVTNDHGRHLDTIRDGFKNHGCDCDGCRHINLFAFGPDFKKGVIENTKRGQIDIPATVAELMGFEFPNRQGQVMTELFEKNLILN